MSDSIASEADLRAFSALPAQQKRLTSPLRGVLAEVALFGRARYSWSALSPLLSYMIERVLLEYDEQSRVEVGPAAAATEGESVTQTVERFKALLARHEQAPWTIQRLAELLLEPAKQYSQLSKVALALEKLLLVTSELPQGGEPLPPAPPLSELLAKPVNENPPKVYTSRQTGVLGGDGRAGPTSAGAAGRAATDTGSAGEAEAAGWPQHRPEAEMAGMGLAAAALGIHAHAINTAPEAQDVDMVPADEVGAAAAASSSGQAGHAGEGAQGPGSRGKQQDVQPGDPALAGLAGGAAADATMLGAAVSGGMPAGASSDVQMASSSAEQPAAQ